MSVDGGESPKEKDYEEVRISTLSPFRHFQLWQVDAW